VPHAKKSQVVDGIRSTPCNRLPVIDLQIVPRVTARALYTSVSAAPRVAFEHRIAHGDRDVRTPWTFGFTLGFTLWLRTVALRAFLPILASASPRGAFIPSRLTSHGTLFLEQRVQGGLEHLR
jgi:hypothetical protein